MSEDCWCRDVPAYECECGETFEEWSSAKRHATKQGGRHAGHDLTEGGCRAHTDPPAKYCSKPSGHGGEHAACVAGQHPAVTWEGGR